MKYLYIFLILLCSIAIIWSFEFFKSRSLDAQLDQLEKIIDKYEPKFDEMEYGSKKYSEMIIEYNKEIFEWAEVFEKGRYEKDSKGNHIFDDKDVPVPNKEFKKVEKRFYELNHRMTKMVLRKIPKPERPQLPEKEPSER